MSNFRTLLNEQKQKRQIRKQENKEFVNSVIRGVLDSYYQKTAGMSLTKTKKTELSVLTAEMIAENSKENEPNGNISLMIPNSISLQRTARVMVWSALFAVSFLIGIAAVSFFSQNLSIFEIISYGFFVGPPITSSLILFIGGGIVATIENIIGTKRFFKWSEPIIRKILIKLNKPFYRLENHRAINSTKPKTILRKQYLKACKEYGLDPVKGAGKVFFVAVEKNQPVKAKIYFADKTKFNAMKEELEFINFYETEIQKTIVEDDLVDTLVELETKAAELTEELQTILLEKEQVKTEKQENDELFSLTNKLQNTLYR